MNSSGSSGFPYTPLLLLSQRLARGAADIPGQREEVIWAWEAACAIVVCAVKDTAQDAVVAWESAMNLVKEVEDHAALAEMVAQERVSRLEVESATTLASAHREAEVFAQRIALLEGELVEGCQAQDAVEVNSWGLFDVAVDAEQRW
jgi:hypothetical protein